MKINNLVSFYQKQLNSHFFILNLGITFKTKLIIPEECHREPLCEVIKDKLKTGAELNLEGDVTAMGLNLRASYTGRGISFGDNMLMMNVSLVVGVGYDGTQYFFEGEMRFLKQKLSFNGKKSNSCELHASAMLRKYGTRGRNFCWVPFSLIFFIVSST